MSKPMGIALVVVLVVVNSVLGVLAWRHIHQKPTPSGISAAQRASVDVQPTLTPKPTPFSAADAVALDATDAGAVLIGTRGSCRGTAGSVLFSIDGGKTLTPATLDVKEVLAVDITKGAWLVTGADADCKPTTVASTDDGKTWKDSDAKTWHPGLTDLSQVTSPTTSGTVGCSVVSLSAVDDDFARAACTDGRIRGTGTAGKTWLALGKLKDVRTVSFSSFTAGVALAKFEGCAASAFTTSDGGRHWKTQGCVGGNRAQAVVATDSKLVAVVDGKVSISDDGGHAWGPA